MANELFFISVRWVGSTFNPPLIDAVLGAKGDWVRLNGWTWLFWADTDPSQIRLMLQKHLHTDDTLIVMVASPMGADGWAPAWVWEWINEKFHQKLGIAPGAPVPGSGLLPPGT